MRLSRFLKVGKNNIYRPRHALLHCDDILHVNVSMYIHARVNSMHGIQDLPDIYFGYAIVHPVVLLMRENRLHIDLMWGVLSTSIKDDDHFFSPSLHFKQAFYETFSRDLGSMDCLEGRDLCQSLSRHTLSEIVVASH